MIKVGVWPSGYIDINRFESVETLAGFQAVLDSLKPGDQFIVFTVGQCLTTKRYYAVLPANPSMHELILKKMSELPGDFLTPEQKAKVDEITQQATDEWHALYAKEGSPK